MKESINESLQALCTALEPLVKAIYDFAKSLGRVFCNVCGSESPCKPIHNYPEYKCIKPNTKPYSAFKRLYRAQRRINRAKL